MDLPPDDDEDSSPQRPPNYDDFLHRRRMFLFGALGIILSTEENDNNSEGNQQPTSFRNMLNLEGRQQRLHQIPRASLQHPSMSAWCYLYGSGNDQALITVCGIDHRTFRELLELFEPFYDLFTPYANKDGSGPFMLRLTETRGRPRSLEALQCLGLCLMWTRTRGPRANLCMIFGTTSSITSLWLRFGIRLLVAILRAHNDAKMRYPTVEEIAECKAAVLRRHPALQGVYCFVDGLKLYLEQSSHAVIQNYFYNGWTHDHYVNNVFAFLPSGVIWACVLNAPGAWHDSYIAEMGGLYDKLEQMWERNGGKCLMDSAFISGENAPYVVKSSQDDAFHIGAQEVVVRAQATACRQAAEWGMRAYQSSFPRIKDRFTYETHGDREQVLRFITNLYNFRVRRVGKNQIQSVYMFHLSQDANWLLHLEPADDN